MENHKGKIAYAPYYVVTVLLLLLGATRCTTPARVPDAGQVSFPTEEVANGHVLFERYCATCHPGGGSGLGPSINNKPLPKFLIRFQIRNGVGVMPGFDEDLITDEQVQNIAEYLVYLRKEERQNAKFDL